MSDHFLMHVDTPIGMGLSNTANFLYIKHEKTNGFTIVRGLIMEKYFAGHKFYKLTVTDT